MAAGQLAAGACPSFGGVACGPIAAPLCWSRLVGWVFLLRVCPAGCPQPATLRLLLVRSQSGLKLPRLLPLLRGMRRLLGLLHLLRLFLLLLLLPLLLLLHRGISFQLRRGALQHVGECSSQASAWPTTDPTPAQPARPALT